MSIGKNYLENFSTESAEPQKQVPEPIKEGEAEVAKVEEAAPVIKENEEVAPVAEDKTVAPIENEEAKPVETAIAEPIVEEEKTSVELSDEAVLAYFKEKKGKELTSLDDLFKEPEAAADPYEGLSDDALQFVKYNKETGRSFKDFQALNRDVDSVSSLELARERAMAMAGGKLTKDTVDGYLEKKLGIDLSDPNSLEEYDEVDLESFVGDYRKEIKANQEKYNQPIVREGSKDKPEMVKLEDGSLMAKAQYDKIVNDRNEYLQESKKAQDNIKSDVFEVTIDDNGNELKMNIPFDYGKNDKHNMLSYASDTNEFIKNNFSTEGKLDHAKLQKGLWFSLPENQGKVISAAIHKARAEWVEESMKQSSNANFNTKKLPSEQQKGRTVPIPGVQSGYGVKFSPEMFK